MKQVLALALIACTALSVQAQTTAPAKAKPAAKAPAKAAPAAKKQPAKPVEAPLPEADAEQLEAAKLAYLGDYECEFKQSIKIEPSAKKEGYVDVHHLKQVYVMKPVRSSTGALRLEDVTGRTLMIQIANKSMLLDVKIGQRIVDDCINPAQRELMAKMAAEKAARAASGVAEEDTGLGIGK
ncbi:hypothetical protein ACFJGW_19475 [Burkholderiaceae bacterium UC74_6]